MPPRTKQGEVPKPVLKKGALGCLPLNTLTLACLHMGHADCLIDLDDGHQSSPLKATNSLQVGKGRQKVKVDLTGRFYNGYSDALYRGQLPEVILAAPSAERFPDYIFAFTTYVEQLAKLGFFLPRKQIIQRDAVGELIPCTVLTGDGLLFSRFITELMSNLKHLQHEHPSLTEEIRLRIIGRFTRGFWGEDPTGAINLNPVNTDSDSLPVVPTQIHIAGGDLWTQGTLQNVLGLHGLQTTVTPQKPNAPERLEFQNALVRVSTVILPALINLDVLSESEAANLAPKIQEGIWAIGVKRAVLTEAEKPEQAVKPLSGQPKTKPKKALKKDIGQTTKPAGHFLGWGDVAIMAGLNHYAQALNLPEESQLFETLTQKLLSHCQQQ